MTTHQHRQHRPVPSYPTAPPWAPRQAGTPRDHPPPGYGSVTPYGAAYPQHGQLLVRYPEEIVNTARSQPPSWWPVVGWTVLFAVGGLVSAIRRAGQARRGRNSPAPYWVAWGLTVAALAALGGVATGVAVPAYRKYRENVVTGLVQDGIRADGRLRASTKAAVSTAICDPVGPRDATGMRRYDCVLVLEDGRTGSLTVTADMDGDFSAVRKR